MIGLKNKKKQMKDLSQNTQSDGKIKLTKEMPEIKEGMAKRIAEYIGIKGEDLPSVRILDTRKDIKKYIMEGTIDEKNILNFIDGWEQGKLKLHLKTQEEPKDNNGDIFVVVGKTFQKEVIDNDKDVSFNFIARQLSPFSPK